MKSTGIVRKIDNLGRIVLPRELRKQFQVKDGDSFEFFVDDEQIILRKYLPLGNDLKDIYYMCLTLEKQLGYRVYFFEGSEVIDVQLLSQNVSKKLTTTFIQTAHTFHSISFNDVQMYTDEGKTVDGYVYPVVVDGEFFGAFVVVTMGKELTETEILKIATLSDLIRIKHEI